MRGSPTQNLGDWGERVAAWWLKKQGYVIIKQHYTSRFGEIDLIAKDKDQVVFIEVKLRMGINSGLPEESVDFRKLLRMKKVILFYLSQNPTENFRVDVVSILTCIDNKRLKIRHHKSLSDMFA